MKVPPKTTTACWRGWRAAQTSHCLLCHTLLSHPALTTWIQHLEDFDLQEGTAKEARAVLVSDPEVLPKWDRCKAGTAPAPSLLSCPGTSQARLMLPTPRCSPWGTEVICVPNKPVCDQKVPCNTDLCRSQVNLNVGVVKQRVLRQRMSQVRSVPPLKWNHFISTGKVFLGATWDSGRRPCP